MLKSIAVIGALTALPLMSVYATQSISNVTIVNNGSRKVMLCDAANSPASGAICTSKQGLKLEAHQTLHNQTVLVNGGESFCYDSGWSSGQNWSIDQNNTITVSDNC